MTTEEDWWVKEYAQDIHTFLRSKERKRYVYRGQSPQLSNRKRLVNWLDAVCTKMDYSTSVQHLAMYLLDIFMDNHSITSDHLQMVVLGCLTVALKLEEKDSLIPKNSELNAFLSNRYKLSEFVQMEMAVLKFFHWEVLYPTAAHFVEYYALYAFHPTDYHDGKPLPANDWVKMYVRKYLDYFLEVSLHDHVYLKFYPSAVAAACIVSTRMCLLLTPTWPPYLQNVTLYKYALLKPCVELLLRTLNVDVKATKDHDKDKTITETVLKNGDICDNRSGQELALNADGVLVS